MSYLVMLQKWLWTHSFNFIVNLLETTTPPTFGEISRVIATLNDNTYLTENHRCTALDIIIKRHRESSSNMLKVDILKLIGQIGYSSDPIMMIILPSLISANVSHLVIYLAVIS